jgi:vancomycin resistance protein YoaR
MRGIKAKRLRSAAGYRPSRDRTQYENQEFRTKLYERLTADGQKALEACQITKPMRVKARTPRQIYRLLKRLERTVGLDKVYAGLMQEHLSGVTA